MPSAIFANDHSVLSDESAYRAHHPGETDKERKVAVEVTEEMMEKQKLTPEEISYNKYLSDNKIDQGVILWLLSMSLNAVSGCRV